jgi:uncharacterized protein
VKVKVISADLKTKRIALSIKALMEPAARPAPKSGKTTKPQATLDEKLAALSTKWKMR